MNFVNDDDEEDPLLRFPEKWTGADAEHNPWKDAAVFTPHIVWRVRSSVSGHPEMCTIATLQEQALYCKQEGLALPTVDQLVLRNGPDPASEWVKHSGEALAAYQKDKHFDVCGLCGQRLPRPKRKKAAKVKPN